MLPVVSFLLMESRETLLNGRRKVKFLSGTCFLAGEEAKGYRKVSCDAFPRHAC